MPKFKKINKTEEVWLHLCRYGSINRPLAVAKWNCYTLPDTIMRIKRTRLKPGQSIEFIPGYGPQGKYQLKEE